MGFFDADMITMVLAYEAFVYVAAQLINSSRIRWEEARLAKDVHGAGTAVRDYHSAFGTALLVNGWILAFFSASTSAIAVTSVLDLHHEMLPANRWVSGLWSTILLVLSALSHQSLYRSYVEESSQMGVTRPFRRTWPSLKLREPGDG